MLIKSLSDVKTIDLVQTMLYNVTWSDSLNRKTLDKSLPDSKDT